jgi:hypothetical protein
MAGAEAMQARGMIAVAKEGAISQDRDTERGFRVRHRDMRGLSFQVQTI